MTIDLSPIIGDAVGLAGTALLVVGTWAAQRLAQRLGIQLTADQQQLLKSTLTQAINAGAAGAQTLAQLHGWDHPEVKNATVSGALDFVSQHGASELKQLGLDMSNPADAARVTAHIQALLPTAMAPVASSPVTTNGPAQPVAAA